MQGNGEVQREGIVGGGGTFSACTTSSGVSPQPSMMDVFVTCAPASFAILKTSRDCFQLARRSRTKGVVRST